MFYCLNCFSTKPELRQTLVTIGEDEEEDFDDFFAFDNGTKSGDDKEQRGTFTKVGV